NNSSDKNTQHISRYPPKTHNDKQPPPDCQGEAVIFGQWFKKLRDLCVWAIRRMSVFRMFFTYALPAVTHRIFEFIPRPLITLIPLRLSARRHVIPVLVTVLRIVAQRRAVTITYRIIVVGIVLGFGEMLIEVV